MTRARASLPTLIAAVERASGRLDGSSPPLPSLGMIALEQGYLADAVASLQWLADNREWIVEAVAARRGNARE